MGSSCGRCCCGTRGRPKASDPTVSAACLKISPTSSTWVQPACCAAPATSPQTVYGDAASGLEAIGFAVAQVGNTPQAGETRTTVRYAPASAAAAQLVASYLQPGVNLVEDGTVGSGVVLVTGADWVGITVPEVVDTGAAADPEATTTTVVGVTPPGVPPPGVIC